MESRNVDESVIIEDSTFDIKAEEEEEEEEGEDVFIVESPSSSRTKSEPNPDTARRSSVESSEYPGSPNPDFHTWLDATTGYFKSGPAGSSPGRRKFGHFGLQDQNPGDFLRKFSSDYSKLEVKKKEGKEGKEMRNAAKKLEDAGEDICQDTATPAHTSVTTGDNGKQSYKSPSYNIAFVYSTCTC